MQIQVVYRAPLTLKLSPLVFDFFYPEKKILSAIANLCYILY